LIAAVSRSLRERWPYLCLVGCLVFLDQLTKLLVDRLLPLYESRSVVQGLVSLTYVRNRGAAFGILSDARLPHQATLFAVIGVLALGAIIAYSASLPCRSRVPQTALALVMSGAVGNLLDRARIDFIDVYWGPHHWPAFNVADSAISVGVALLILDMLQSPETPASRETDMPEATSAGRSE
jgi:signal peptidase II